MNHLTINTFDCSLDALGGDNQTTYILTRRFREHLHYNCYLGFYNTLPEDYQLAEFEGRILLNKDFDREKFRAFLIDNKIDIVQVNFLRKETLGTMADIYEISKSLNVKVIHAFHMCPGFQAVTYGSWRMTQYCFWHSSFSRGVNELKKYLLTLARPLLSKVYDRILRNKYNLPFNSCDHLVVLAKNYVQSYMRIAGVTDASKVTHIPNALTFNGFASEEDIDRKKKQIIVVARFDEDTKRISFSLSCWRRIQNMAGLEDWEFVLVGQGRDMDYYQYLVKKWNLQRVVFTGRQHPMEYYRAASIFLMTSTAEGWPMVLAESIQMGVVPVAFDSFASVGEIIQDGYNGYIVPNEDVDAMCEKVIDLMKRDELRKTMARNAVLFSHKFELPSIVEQWRSLFEQLLSSK